MPFNSLKTWTNPHNEQTTRVAKIELERKCQLGVSKVDMHTHRHTHHDIWISVSQRIQQ